MPATCRDAGARAGLTSNRSPIPAIRAPPIQVQLARMSESTRWGGRTCDHWQITDKEGKVSNVWVDRKLHFPIKTVSADSTWELTNIKEGEPDAGLFQIPPGYHKMDMGSMMQGIHPPQQ